MPRDLFGDCTRPSISIGSGKWYTLPLSLVSHSAIVFALIAIPILAPAVMPSVFADDDMTLIKIELPKPPPIRVGHYGVRTPVKTHNVDPVYPPIAQSARIQGIVILEATIGEDGNVMNARILRSVPLLDQAALDAVRQWQFTPTLLNGVPVPVIMTVTVNFTLTR